jgi:hypothetical protein
MGHTLSYKYQVPIELCPFYGSKQSLKGDFMKSWPNGDVVTRFKGSELDVSGIIVIVVFLARGFLDASICMNSIAFFNAEQGDLSFVMNTVRWSTFLATDSQLFRTLIYLQNSLAFRYRQPAPSIR